jgi:hypothetical protein
MAKFNTNTTVSEKLKNRSDATENLENALAFKPSAKMELYLRSCAGFLEDKYYTKSSEQLEGLRRAIFKTDRSFTVKLAKYVRNQMYLRSIPMVLLAEATQERFPGDKKGVDKSIITKYTPSIVKRADELTETVAYYLAQIGKGNKKNMANALKKGLANAFSNFDEYQFAKYNRGGDVKLKDVVRLVHPKPADDERKALYKRILEDELKTPETWEVEISTKGSTAENWNAIAPKMGIMALMRNLRNFEQKGAKEALKIARDKLRDKDVIKKSKQLPFRFYSALQNVSESATRDAILEAMELSIANIPKLEGSVAIYADTSGSMGTPVSRKGTVKCLDIATLMAAMACHIASDDYYAAAFATECVQAPISKRDSVLTNAEKIKRVNTRGCGTEAWKCINQLRTGKKVMDTVIIFSDMQCYNRSASMWGNSSSLAEEWVKYKREVAPKAILYSVDLAGYGTLQFPENEYDVIQIAGWSDRIFDLINSYKNRHSVIEMIEEMY